MSNFADVLDTLVPLVGDLVVEKAKEEINKIAEDADDPTKQIVFSLMAEAVGELGESGLDIAEAEIKRLLNGIRRRVGTEENARGIGSRGGSAAQTERRSESIKMSTFSSRPSWCFRRC